MRPNSLLLPPQLCGRPGAVVPAKYETISMTSWFIPHPQVESQSTIRGCSSQYPPPPLENLAITESQNQSPTSNTCSSQPLLTSVTSSQNCSMTSSHNYSMTSSDSCLTSSGLTLEQQKEEQSHEARHNQKQENLKVFEGLSPSVASPMEKLEKRSEDCNGRLPSDRFGDRKETKSSQTNDSGQDTQVVICQRCQSAHLGRDFDLESDLDDDDDMSTTMEQFYHCLCCVIVVGILALFVTTLIWMFENRQQVPVSPRGHLWTFRSIQSYEHLTREAKSYHLRHSRSRFPF